MKKLLLILFLFCASFANAQTPVPIVQRYNMIKGIISPYYLIGASDTAARKKYVDSLLNIRLFGKVDKIPGKKLSTKDYTETDSLKLAGLTNPTSFELEISTSGTTDIALPFTLKSTALVFVNNSNIRNNLWTGSGTSTITLFLDTRQKDFLKIQNQ